MQTAAIETLLREKGSSLRALGPLLAVLSLCIDVARWYQPAAISATRRITYSLRSNASRSDARSSDAATTSCLTYGAKKLAVMPT